MFHTRCGSAASVENMTTTSTPWGTATLVEKAAIKQRVGAKQFASVLELLGSTDGAKILGSFVDAARLSAAVVV